MVTFDNVVKVYPGDLGKKSVTALNGISFSLGRAEAVAYVGPNGAGKTTSLNILLGLHAPTSGTVRIDGRDPRDPRSRSKIGYLPERPYFYEQLTAVQFLSLCGRLSHLPHDIIKIRSFELLEKLGLEGARDRKLRTFSRGMLQRVGMAQALIHDPDLLVLDEPLNGLDPLGRQLVRGIIADTSARGKTILYSSHILSDAELLADRVAVLSRGRLVTLSTMDELRKQREGFREVTLAPTESCTMERLQELWPSGRTVGRTWVQNVSEYELNTVLLQAVESHAHVMGVGSAGMSLEETLVNLIKDADSSHAERAS